MMQKPLCGCRSPVVSRLSLAVRAPSPSGHMAAGWWRNVSKSRWTRIRDIIFINRPLFWMKRESASAGQYSVGSLMAGDEGSRLLCTHDSRKHTAPKGACRVGLFKTVFDQNSHKMISDSWSFIACTAKMLEKNHLLHFFPSSFCLVEGFFTP